MIKDYIKLTKPGIVASNAFTVTAGYFIGNNLLLSQYLNYLYCIIGVSFIIACGCVINNWLDKDIDSLMSRTKNRYLVLNPNISLVSILSYSIILAIIGMYFLILLPTKLPLIITFIGLFIYIILYTLLFKRNSVHGTFIGAFSGATPMLAGYFAGHNVTFSIYDVTKCIVIVLFMILWQMPHFFAIAIYRIEDYKSAYIKVLPVVKGLEKTASQIKIYICLFLLNLFICIVLFNMTYLSLVLLLFIGIIWLRVTFLYPKDIKIKARKIFILSILVIVIDSVIFVLDKTLNMWIPGLGSLLFS